jgi:putative transcriptional regulator
MDDPAPELVSSLQGRLIVAAPSLIDPNFRRAVVLIAAHGDDGAMGIVLNRPTELKLSEASDALDALAGAGELVYQGGPVQTSAIIVLAEWDEPERAAAIVLDRVGFVPGDEDIELLEPYVSRARVFAGHAGWGPDQLESELEREDWIVVEASAEDVFSEEPEALWGDVLAREGGQYALLARMPADPSLN